MTITSSVLEVLEKLNTLSAKELKAVRSEVERLLCSRSQIDVQLYQAVCTVIGSDLPISQFERTSDFKQWIKNQEIVIDFIDVLTDGLKLNRGDKLKLRLAMAKMIKMHLEAMKVPVSIRTMTANMWNIILIFGQEYPGYLQSGLRQVVVEALLSRRSNS